MTILEIQGDWNIIKGKLKQKWPSLTPGDLHYAEGKLDELLGRIQKRTGETREAIIKVINESCAISDHGDHKHTHETLKAAGPRSSGQSKNVGDIVKAGYELAITSLFPPNRRTN